MTKSVTNEVEFWYQQGIKHIDNDNYYEAFKYLKNSADAGHFRAAGIIGHMYYLGEGISIDYTQAFKYLLMASSRTKNGITFFYLGKAYYSGRGTEKNIEQAIYWLNKALDHNITKAYNLLGLIYTDIDYKQSIHYFEQGVISEDYGAAHNLGWAYYKGLMGVTVNYDKAYELFKMAALNGDDEGSCFNLAQMYNEGHGVKVDQTHAFYWYKKSADLGLDIGQVVTAEFYLNSTNPANHKRALEYYKKAAEAGHPVALYNLGMMYREGKGVERNFSESISWLQKAADKSYAPAEKSMCGALYLNSYYVSHDYKNTFVICKQLATSGIAEAQTLLAKMYKHALGTEKNDIEFVKWLVIAARNGSDEAIKALTGCRGGEFLQEILHNDYLEIEVESDEILPSIEIDQLPTGVNYTYDVCINCR